MSLLSMRELESFESMVVLAFDDEDLRWLAPSS